MNIDKRCLECIYNQANRVCELLNIQGALKESILNTSKAMVADMSFTLTPPQNATPMYEMIAKKLEKRDIYDTIKIDSIQHALEFSEYCQELIDSSDEKLHIATKVAIIGNVIDLASTHMFDLKTEVEKVVTNAFAIDDFENLHEDIKRANTIVYLADNAGEDVFDKLYIKTIKELYPNIKIYYFVRGKPIINDLTVDDLWLSKIDEVATIIDSGVHTPGIVRLDLHENAQKLFESADIIISKGMGNYECLSEERDLPIYFLLKIKCDVVADSLEQNVGDIICKKIGVS